MTDTTKCLICQAPIKEPEPLNWVNDSLDGYSCPRCGDYWVGSYTKGCIQDRLRDPIHNTLDEQKVAKLSHWVRTKHEANMPNEQGRRKLIILDKKLIDSIIKSPRPSPAEQADKFVLWLGDNIEYADHYIEANKFSIQAIIGAINESEFDFVLSHLKDKGIIKTKTAVGRGNTAVTLSFEGWEYLQKLKLGSVDSQKAFMAMQYDDAQLDIIVEETFKPAVKQTGFDLFKLPDRPKAGLIDDRIRTEIQTSRFLISDLTHENRGAYWEAGYAEGLGKPVIYTCEKKKFKRLKTHFDTNHHLTIRWDADNPGEVAEELKATIRATLPAEAKLTDE